MAKVVDWRLSICSLGVMTFTALVSAAQGCSARSANQSQLVPIVSLFIEQSIWTLRKEEKKSIRPGDRGRYQR
jgi:hypothetical protein